MEEKRHPILEKQVLSSLMPLGEVNRILFVQLLLNVFLVVSFLWSLLEIEYFLSLYSQHGWRRHIGKL